MRAVFSEGDSIHQDEDEDSDTEEIGDMGTTVTPDNNGDDLEGTVDVADGRITWRIDFS